MDLDSSATTPILTPTPNPPSSGEAGSPPTPPPSPPVTPPFPPPTPSGLEEPKAPPPPLAPNETLAPNIPPSLPKSEVGPPPPPIATVSIPRRGFPFKIIIVLLVILLLVGGGLFAVKTFVGLPQFGSSTLTYWGLWEQDSVIKPLIDEYQKAHSNIKITYVQQSPQEYRERLQTALGQGKGPDIFRLHSSWIPMFKSDLTPVPSDFNFTSTFYPVAQASLKSGTGFLALPLEYDGLAMYVNDDLLAQNGLTPPQNWDDLRKTAQALASCESEDGKCHPGSKILISGAAMGTSDNVDHWQDILAVLMLQNNVNLDSPSGKSAEDALDYFTIFNRVDHMWDSTLPSSTFQFASGKVGIYFAPSWRVFDIQAQNPQLRFSIHPLPQLPLDPARGEQPVTWASFWVEGVNKKGAHTKEAWDFLKFLSSQESLQKLYQQAASSGRAFGEPYPRVDMADSLKSAPLVGAYITEAPLARTWYLASNTWDGSTGINSRLTTIFADAVNKALLGGQLTETVTTLNTGINQVLSSYGLVAPLPVKK